MPSAALNHPICTLECISQKGLPPNAGFIQPSTLGSVRRMLLTSPIDLCIKNAIIGVQEQNTYAQTERERRPTRRSAQASPGVVGFWLLSQRSGTAHWLQSKFGDALARCPTEGRSQGIARTLLPRTTAEVGAAASTALGQPSSAGADDARLSNQSLDHRPHCGIDPEPVRNPVPPRSRRTLDA